jgi:hypothetical protein
MHTAEKKSSVFRVEKIHPEALYDSTIDFPHGLN